jgi:hypothetical protein
MYINIYEYIYKQALADLEEFNKFNTDLVDAAPRYLYV